MQRYSHEAMISLIIEQPLWSHSQYAAFFGRTASWFAAILATDGFQQALDPYRDEITDPSITATMDERLRAIALRSMTVLQHKLEDLKVPDETVLKGLEVTAKALGLGMGKKSSEEPVHEKVVIMGIEGLAESLVDKMKLTGQGRLSAPKVPGTTRPLPPDDISDVDPKPV